jgi:hypothetical protein
MPGAIARPHGRFCTLAHIGLTPGPAKLSLALGSVLLLGRGAQCGDDAGLPLFANAPG